MPLAPFLEAQGFLPSGSVTVDSITTSDRYGSSSPFKVSDVSGYDQATVTFTVTGTGPVGAWEMRSGGTGVINGTRVASLGFVCGLAVCGVNGPAAIATPHTFEVDVDGNALPSEGDNDMYLYVYSGGMFE